jgi:hypothetical protein
LIESRSTRKPWRTIVANERGESIMLDIRNDLAGSAVFWTISGESDYQALAGAMSLQGFSKFTPDVATEYSALRAALEEAYPGHKFFPVKDHPARFEVIKVSPNPYDAKRNQFEHVTTASASKDWQEVTDDNGLNTDLTERFRKHRQSVTHGCLTEALIKIVFELGGTTLRPSGGVYWIPNHNWERWEALAQAIELAGAKNKLFALRTIFDENSACAIREALATEIAREAKTINDTLTDPESGKRAAANARKNASNLRDKIIAYEGAFTMSLEDLKTQLTQATCIEAKAALLDAAASGGSILGQLCMFREE